MNVIFGILRCCVNILIHVGVMPHYVFICRSYAVSISPSDEEASQGTALMVAGVWIAMGRVLTHINLQALLLDDEYVNSVTL